MNPYSLFGEEKLILEYFIKLDSVSVEVGAHAPFLASQTYLLGHNGRCASQGTDTFWAASDGKFGPTFSLDKHNTHQADERI